jgi:RNA polymerase sigma-70 factor (ECF subfamily)
MKAKFPATRARDDERAVEEALNRKDYRAAVDLLVKLFAGTLNRFCALRCGSAVAEDLAQVVFAQAFSDIAAFRRGVSPLAWLLGIARNRCKDHLRSVTRERERFEPGGDDDQTPASDSWFHVEAALDEPARRRLLGGFLNRIDQQVAFAIALRYLEGFSYPEMADICGEAPDTMRQRVSRGFAELQRLAGTSF